MAECYVTLVLNNQYVIGALVLGHSLRKTHTTKKLVCLVGPDVSHDRRLQLLDIFDDLVDVQVQNSADAARLKLLQRPELGITFTKLEAWRLTQYQKCVFLDADTLVLQNVDDLFQRPSFAAAPDIGWPDCFNSGVFVFEPSDTIYRELCELAAQEGSFDGGDQGLLNRYFSQWRTSPAEYRLPFTDNMTANAAYGYAPAYEQFRHSIRIIHFIGAQKPWMGSPASGAHALQSLHGKWWEMRMDLTEARSDTVSYATHMGFVPSGGVSPNANFVSPHDKRVQPLDPRHFLESRSADEIVDRIRRLASPSHSEHRSSPARGPSYGPVTHDDDGDDDDDAAAVDGDGGDVDGGAGVARKK